MAPFSHAGLPKEVKSFYPLPTIVFQLAQVCFICIFFLCSLDLNKLDIHIVTWFTIDFSIVENFFFPLSFYIYFIFTADFCCHLYGLFKIFNQNFAEKCLFRRGKQMVL